MILVYPSLLRKGLAMFTTSSILQLKYQNTGEENNEEEELINLESVRALEGVALQHGFVGRLVSIEFFSLGFHYGPGTG